MSDRQGVFEAFLWANIHDRRLRMISDAVEDLKYDIQKRVEELWGQLTPEEQDAVRDGERKLAQADYARSDVEYEVVKQWRRDHGSDGESS